MASKAMKNNKLLTRMKSTFEQENHFVQLINGELQPCKKASRHNRKNVPHRTYWLCKDKPRSKTSSLTQDKIYYQQETFPDKTNIPI